ncbi:sensor histidine kinase [Caballeronia concitans]|uniref:histidine kinase n=1 Tax=Caballeronia concitans TaxID=1777133 RepID=A0A658QUF4_9BURK|nr:HAMP domain-containing sensor histidine kinase [Caballeronia concitans]KIG09953.1 histidine kinase [Burkholderia sp. MR1]SAL22332.1 histidine kinase [Caballeronia concitans]
MTLSDFIEANLSGLIDDWTKYARELSAENIHLTDTQLRNSAREMLLSVAADMRETQTGAEQKAKSLGQRPRSGTGFDRVAQRHADDRLEHGFGINAIVAEYRALRASVLRRWELAAELDAGAFQEMVRFNEAIDQMVAGSVQQYSQRTERIRDLFAGVLAHDMRSPAAAILNGTELLLLDEHLSNVSVRAVANLQRSSMRLKQMIDDLFMFTRARLGDALPIELTQQNMGRICEGAADEVRAACPDAQIDVHLEGELAGVWDGARMNQLLVNLLTNAVRHGSGPVTVKGAGGEENVTLAVCNAGSPIPPNALPTLFDPLTRAGPSPGQRRAASGMGLGLYICRCIARAHGGTIDAESDERGTIFTVQVPRSPSAQ